MAIGGAEMIKWFKSFICKHKWMPDGYISDQYEPCRYKLVRIWKCSKCGKVKIGQFK